MLIQLVCPTCHKPIVKEPDGWRCPACRKLYTEKRGVLSFLDTVEVFGSGDYGEEQQGDWASTAQLRDRIRQSRLLAFLNLVRIKFSLSGRRDRVFYDEMSGGDRNRLILDLGCGGGRHYFCDYGRVVGVDPVLDLLQIAKNLYAEVYQASATDLPFADNTFDYVVSSDVLGHVPAGSKDRVFAELHRVLKPGGRTVHVIETDATNCWYLFAHRHPDLFRKHFVDRPGHVGLELPTQLRARFLKHGFKEVRFRKMGTNVLECGMVAAFFNNEFKAHCSALKLLAPLDALLARSLPVKEGVNVLLELAAKVDDLFSPLDHASGALVVFEK